MKRLAILLTLIIAVFGLTVSAQTSKEAAESKFDADLAKKLGADDYGMRSYVFVLLKTGPAKIEDKAKLNEIFKGHMANMGRLAKEGKLVLAGPFSDPNKVKRGLFIFASDSLEEVDALVKTDPGVIAGVFDYELTKWYGSAAVMQIRETHEKVQKTKF